MKQKKTQNEGPPAPRVVPERLLDLSKYTQEGLLVVYEESFSRDLQEIGPGRHQRLIIERLHTVFGKEKRYWRHAPYVLQSRTSLTVGAKEYLGKKITMITNKYRVIWDIVTEESGKTIAVYRVVPQSYLYE
jgi:hypothetical protein